ncbi:bacillithiol biosynthesis deacetylase BshB1 [Crocinitomicaceae bacterium]|nr:bacillithiol biosynthesis deacetylase BshB1 [Crocinitomicaceae bacterium]
MKLDILAFAAHPDDIELGCSGTIIKQIKAGFKVGIIDMTQGELGSRGTAETRSIEAEEASRIMGVKERKNLMMRDGFFEISEQNKILLIQQIRKYQPEIVLANALSDRHPDHGRAGQLVLEACYLSGLRKIETSLNGQTQEAHRPNVVYNYVQDYYQKPDFVVDVTEFIDQKMQAIAAYKTQFYDPNSKEPETPISGKGFLDAVFSRMTEYGRPAGYRYAEGFTTQRFLGIELLTDLK